MIWLRLNFLKFIQENCIGMQMKFHSFLEKFVFLEQCVSEKNNTVNHYEIKTIKNELSKKHNI